VTLAREDLKAMTREDVAPRTTPANSTISAAGRITTASRGADLGARGSSEDYAHHARMRRMNSAQIVEAARDPRFVDGLVEEKRRGVR
jgi:hypothetical protein